MCHVTRRNDSFIFASVPWHMSYMVYLRCRSKGLWVESFLSNTYIHTYIHAYIPAYLPTYLHTYVAYQRVRGQSHSYETWLIYDCHVIHTWHTYLCGGSRVRGQSHSCPKGSAHMLGLLLNMCHDSFICWIHTYVADQRVRGLSHFCQKGSARL